MTPTQKEYTQAEVDTFKKVLSMNDGFHSFGQVAAELGFERLALRDALEEWDTVGRPEATL